MLPCVLLTAVHSGLSGTHTYKGAVCRAGGSGEGRVPHVEHHVARAPAPPGSGRVDMTGRVYRKTSYTSVKERFASHNESRDDENQNENSTSLEF